MKESTESGFSLLKNRVFYICYRTPMRYKLSPRLIEFAHKAASIPGVKWCLKPFYYSYKEKSIKERTRIFHQNAFSVLKDFDDALSSHNVKYTLAFGTLLGAVREHGFIKHDLDIDTAIWHDEYLPDIPSILRSAGFTLIHSFSVDNGRKGLEQTYIKNNVTIDIFYFYHPINKYPYTCIWYSLPGSSTWRESMKKEGYVGVARLELPFSRDIISVNLGPLSLPAPSNYSEFLEYRYGPDYMIPDAEWHPSNRDSCFVDWPSEKAEYTEYK